VDSDYDKIIAALHNASRFCVPKCKTSFFKHYWDDDLSDLKMKSIEANRLWIECGRPRSGYILQEKCQSKAVYKRVLRNKQREHDIGVSNDLHECLLNKNMDSFWRTWRCKFGAKTALPVCVDGVSDCPSIAQIFASNFADACKPNSASRFDCLKHEFETVYDNYDHPNVGDVGTLVISVEFVEKCLGTLKNGKAAGIDGIEAEHLKMAHPKSIVLLCILFNKMLLCGKVPEVCCSGVIIPVPKDKSGDLTNSRNYRGITLSPVISKVFEMCLLDLYSELLYSMICNLASKNS